jgi:hypothetical protein
MRRLRRSHARHARQTDKPYSKLRRRALAAGTVVAIACGTGLALNKALAGDPHHLPVVPDADADLLSNPEESAIGYRPFQPDQNRNEIPDGVELAKRCIAVMAQLPTYFSPLDVPPGLSEPHIVLYFAKGYEYCDACGELIEMGMAEIINPKLGLTAYCTFIAAHYLGHGSFSYAAGSERGRVDVQQLLTALQLCFPCDPNEHQLPLDYPDPCDAGRTLAPDTNDLDGDLLADSEELAAGYDLHDPDQDRDLSPDGIELATQCAEAIEHLPIYDPLSGDPAPTQTYKVNRLERGFELCRICGGAVNMGFWEVVNPRSALNVDVYDIACHYMSHGSFSYSGQTADPPHAPFHYGRMDIPLLARALEMPRHCGHFGTIYLPGDLTADCKADFEDLSQLARDWLLSTQPE